MVAFSATIQPSETAQMDVRSFFAMVGACALRVRMAASRPSIGIINTSHGGLLERRPVTGDADRASKSQKALLGELNGIMYTRQLGALADVGNPQASQVRADGRWVWLESMTTPRGAVRRARSGSSRSTTARRRDCTRGGEQHLVNAAMRTCMSAHAA